MLGYVLPVSMYLKHDVLKTCVKYISDVGKTYISEIRAIGNDVCETKEQKGVERGWKREEGNGKEEYPQEDRYTNPSKRKSLRTKIQRTKTTYRTTAP